MARHDQGSSSTPKEQQVSLQAFRNTPRYTYLIAAVAATGGMLFGYDIGVISGAENLLKTHFHLSSGTEELAVAAVLIGAVIGGTFGGRLADRISRRYTLMIMAGLYAVDEDEGELAWQTDALCAQTDPEAFFPEKGGSTRDAKRVCEACPVQAECLDYAMSKDEKFGIWGGLSERERRRLRRLAR